MAGSTQTRPPTKESKLNVSLKRTKAQNTMYNCCGINLTIRILKLHLHIMPHQGVAGFLPDPTTCTLKLTSTLGSRDYLAFRYVQSSDIVTYFQLFGSNSKVLLEPCDFVCK